MFQPGSVRVALPKLIIVAGFGGYGKTTLAHRLGAAIGCPVISRDEIKQGMAREVEGFTPADGDPLTMRTLGVFFDVLGLLIDGGATVVAEAAFQDHVWRPRLEPFADRARIRVIRCTIDPDLSLARVAARALTDPHRAAHDDQGFLALKAGPDKLVPISIDVPTLDVDTTDGYRPSLDEIVKFIDA